MQAKEKLGKNMQIEPKIHATQELSIKRNPFPNNGQFPNQGKEP